MNSMILIRSSIGSVRRHAVRSLLTVLGITIGISAIIVTFSIGRGAEIKISTQIQSMGEGASYIIPGNLIERGGQRMSDVKSTLKARDIESIKTQIPAIEAIARGSESFQNVSYNSTEIKERIYSTDAAIININNNAVEHGSFFTDHEVTYRQNVAVLGNETAKKLFGTEDALNKTIRINNRPFTVIGILGHIDHFFGGSDPNSRIYIPFTVGKKFFRNPKEGVDDLGFIAMRVNADTNGDKILTQIKRTLRFMHNIAENGSDDFTIFDQKSISQAAQQAAAVIKLFGLIAASISLLVGGIGIMNIMFVTVQERTREIGIRLAIGATQKMIQLQFLIEAIVLCSAGGILGILLGLCMQYFLSKVTKLPGIIEPIPLLLSFLLTIVIGVFFGYYPARKASRLNPVEALFEK